MSDIQIRAAASQALETFASKSMMQTARSASHALALIETAGGPASPGPSGTLQVGWASPLIQDLTPHLCGLCQQISSLSAWARQVPIGHIRYDEESLARIHQQKSSRQSVEPSVEGPSCHAHPARGRVPACAGAVCIVGHSKSNS